MLSVKTKTRFLVSLFLVILVPTVMLQLVSSDQVVRDFQAVVELSRDVMDHSVAPHHQMALSREARERLAKSNQEILQVNVISFVVGITGTVLALIMGWVFYGSIVRPISILKQGIDKVIEGDLDSKIPLEGHDEFSQLACSFNKMTLQLRENKNRLQLIHNQLFRANEHLEAHQRELICSNEKLQLEIAIREKAEQTLEATVAHLKIANRDLEDFAFVAAHDLKTPLRGIGTLADMIRHDYSDRLDEQGLYMLDLLLQRTQRIHALVGGILQYAKLMKNGAIIQRRISTRQIVQQAIDHVGPPVHVEVIIDGELPDVVGDETHLLQIFQNLIDNAVKYMDKPHGVITIQGGTVQDFWRFSVTDNGPGIDPKYQEKIFKIFQTLMSKDEFDATGIGLSLIRKIVERYEGQVWVESQVGTGSTFFFTLKQQDLPEGQESVLIPIERRHADRRKIHA